MGARQKILARCDCAQVLAGGRAVSFDIEDADLVSRHLLVFQRTKSTACIVAIDRKTSRSTRLARLLMSPGPGKVVDHINGNPLDNRRCNLRMVTPARNNQNRAKQVSGSSQYKGVSARTSSWVAGIWLNGRRVHLGSFSNERDAASAYDAAAREHFGEYATLNFPKVGEQSAHRPRTISFHANPNSAEAQA